ncbi:MAG: YabP/YqfC family sporulation protein [Firmicutes bacterium]|nr:YabP/YqfC family sporulation protein [Bacillota bacterium]
MDNSQSNLTLTNRKELSLTGIKKVKSTEPNMVVASLGETGVVISGSNLSVEHLDIKEEQLIITGTIDSIKFTNTVSKNFSIKNMFK